MGSKKRHLLLESFTRGFFMIFDIPDKLLGLLGFF